MLVECLINEECPLDKACRDKECVNPCDFKHCGPRAICSVEFHIAVCTCPTELQGNPEKACVEVGCRSNNECDTDQECTYYPPGSYTKKECRPVCGPDSCHPQARCEGRNHQRLCTCNPPLQGDGVVVCAERKTIPTVRRILSNFLNFVSVAVIAEEPECRIDPDCPPRLACIKEICQDPCRFNNPCTGAQKCVVRSDSFSPSRSVSCVCPEGTLAGYGGSCDKGRQVKFKPNEIDGHNCNISIVEPEPQCRTDLDCDPPEKCLSGNCQDACTLITCGANAYCETGFHSGSCVCLPPLIGNPDQACYPGIV